MGEVRVKVGEKKKKVRVKVGEVRVEIKHSINVDLRYLIITSKYTRIFMEEKLRVSKDNALVNASYRLSLTEMQIILYGIGLINPIQPEFPLTYRIDIARFASQFNREHGQIYKEVKEAVLKRFWERDFSYINENGETIILRWLTKVAYKDKTGYLEIKFSEEIQPYLHNLQGNFTAYYIEQIAKFRSIYSVRLYEISLMLLTKNKINHGKFSLFISDLKKQLDLNGKYDRFCDFKPYVLDKAKKEINKFSDLDFDFKVIKLGRSPHQVELSVRRKMMIENKSIAHSDKIQTSLLEQAKKLALEAGTGWDIYAIEDQFYVYTKKIGSPKNLEAAFIGFVKKKIAKKA